MTKQWDDLTRQEKDEILEDYDVLVPNDNKSFQEKARLLQSVWREEQGMEGGSRDDRSPGSRLCMPNAETDLSNFLSENIREMVRRELKVNAERPRALRGLYGEPRIYDNLLSSQALCFNLFGELTFAPDLATNVMNDMTSGRITKVDEIKFEYSPSREDPKYTDDKTAFDVYVVYSTSRGQKGFAGIEVKYHENPNRESGERNHYENHGKRYEELARITKYFLYDNLDGVRTKPIQQFWRDHLLVGAHKIENQFDDAFFAVLYPKDNEACEKAIHRYRKCLADCESFQVWNLECFVERLRHYSSADWIENFNSRYLDFEVLNSLALDDSQ